jgi:hypothetical protein
MFGQKEQGTGHGRAGRIETGDLRGACRQFRHRAARPPDSTHPLGHGRELYFWSFIVALLLFALGAGVSFCEGVVHILSPEPVANPYVNYIVPGLSFLFEGTSWLVALKEFPHNKGRLGWFEAVRASKDPSVFTVLFEDSAALLGLIVAFAGILAAQLLDRPELDGVASLGIAAKRLKAFCADCGSHLYATSDGDGPKVYGIHTGTARQRDRLVPQKQIWHGSKMAWLPEFDGPGFETMATVEGQS